RSARGAGGRRGVRSSILEILQARRGAAEPELGGGAGAHKARTPKVRPACAGQSLYSATSSRDRRCGPNAQENARYRRISLQKRAVELEQLSPNTVEST